MSFNLLVFAQINPPISFRLRELRFFLESALSFERHQILKYDSKKPSKYYIVTIKTLKKHLITSTPVKNTYSFLKAKLRLFFLIKQAYF